MTPFSPAQPRRAETRFSSSVVLSRPSPCNVPQGYAQSPSSLRPRWTVFLSILRDYELLDVRDFRVGLRK